MLQVKLSQVLNLIRDEADKLAQSGTTVAQSPPDEECLRAIVRRAAVLALTAASAPDVAIDAVSDAAARCQSRRYLGRHCGACGEYFVEAVPCPACGGVSP